MGDSNRVTAQHSQPGSRDDARPGRVLSVSEHQPDVQVQTGWNYRAAKLTKRHWKGKSPIEDIGSPAW